MNKLTIANQKGGVGKTATAFNLGYALAASGAEVLLVDTDAQNSLTGACGHAGADPSLADVVGGAQPGELALRDIIRNVSPNLDIAPSDISLSNSELGLISRMGREVVLKKALEGVGDAYGLAIMDCSPSLGMMSVNALVAADKVLVPTQPQEADLRGLRLFLDTIQQVKRELNPGIEYRILITFYDSRLNHHAAALEAIEDAGLPMFETKIGRTVRIPEAINERLPILEYAPDNPRTAEFYQLADEVQSWIKE